MTSRTIETERERLEIQRLRLARDEQEAQSQVVSVRTTPGASEASLHQAWLVWCRLCDSRLEVERLIDEQDQ
jgi:hypothetical protein